jgi:2-dehydro-3-deoxyphosphogluconate aldolase/(4S)-4-hydroxy-2-oxoglutarate aldolase
MMDYQSLEALLENQFVLPIFRNSREEVLKALELMKPLHFKVIELTTTIFGWQLLAKELAADYVVGVGTISNVAQIEEAQTSGAYFLVSFGAFPELISAVKEIPVIPGALTPTEFLALQNTGIPISKLYPASSMGPKYLTDLKVLLPEMKFMATGGIGIDIDSITKWRDAGALAIGMGNALGNPITDPEGFKIKVEKLHQAIHP